MPISADARYEKKSADVLGKRMAYVEAGAGDPIVLLHGNPTSSYLWRNIIPHLEGLGRCIAPDLIGMGDSEKLDAPGPDSYRFVEHRRYVDGLLEALGVTRDVTFVVHDWGSALGFDWANRHRDAVKGIAYMEAIVAPIESWDSWPKAARSIFQGFRSEKGEQMVLEQNLFIEAVLPTSIIRKLSDEEMAVYRRPFASPGEDRRPTLTWPRQIPIAGEPADVAIAEIVADYASWLAESPVAKLFINAKPGAILRGDLRERCRAWPNQREVEVAGIHFVQEDSPDEIGRAIADWLKGIKLVIQHRRPRAARGGVPRSGSLRLHGAVSSKRQMSGVRLPLPVARFRPRLRGLSVGETERGRPRRSSVRDHSQLAEDGLAIRETGLPG